MEEYYNACELARQYLEKYYTIQYSLTRDYDYMLALQMVDSLEPRDLEAQFDEMLTKLNCTRTIIKEGNNEIFRTYS